MLRNFTKVNITKAFIRSTRRNISTTSKLNDIFKVQSEKDFEERVLNSKKVIIVDFMATWCNPCKFNTSNLLRLFNNIIKFILGKLLTPRIETIATENKDKVDLAKVIIIKISD